MTTQVTRLISCVRIQPRVPPAEAPGNLFTNAQFDDDSDWVMSVPIRWAIAGGVATANGQAGNMMQSPVLTPGNSYTISMEVVDVGQITFPQLSAWVGGTCGLHLNPPTLGLHSATVVAGSGPDSGFRSGGCSAGIFDGSIDNVSLIEQVAPAAPEWTVGITDFDRAIYLDGVKYESIHGYTPKQLERANDLSVGNAEIEGILALNGISKDKILDGTYDGALFEWFTYDWGTGTKDQIIQSGTLGEFKLRRGRYVVELLDLTQQLRANILEFTSPTCRVVELGDARCQVDLTPFTVVGTVGTAQGNRQFIDNGRTEEDDWFTKGKIIWQAGSANEDAVSRIKRHIDISGDKTFELVEPLPNAIQDNDPYEMIAGCDRRSETCIGKFANKHRFPGEEDMPSQDEMNRYGGQEKA